MESARALRDVREADLPGVLDVERSAHAHPWSEESLRRELLQGWSTILGAFEGEALAGFAVFWFVHDEVHILDVAVRPDRRRLGVARELLAEIERRAVERTCALVTLEVRRGNTAASALYARAGYVQVGERRRYYSDGEDAVLMTKLLRPP